MTVLDLDQLTQVGGIAIDLNDDVTTVDLSALTTVDGNVTITFNPLLTNLDLSSLTNVNGTFDISENATLATLGTLSGALDTLGIALSTTMSSTT